MFVHQKKRRNLPCLTQANQPSQTLKEGAYSSFAFKDRVTNNEYTYSEALKQRHLALDQWIPCKAVEENKLKHIINTYKFTKHFEMNCIRNKYNLSHKQPDTHQLQHPLPKRTHKSIQPISYKSNKNELRRVLVTGQHVKSQFIRKTIRTTFSKHKAKPKTYGWMIKQTKQNIPLGQQAKRVYDKALNHMNHQLRHKGEYLLNIPQTLKRRNLIRSQFKDNSPNKTQIKTLPSNKLLILNERYNHLSFSNDGRQTNSLECQTRPDQSLQNQRKQLLEVVQQGFINQVFLLISSKLELVWARNQKGNNIFHIVAKEGNIPMLNTLLRVIPQSMISCLLAQKNRIGRTPLQKAQMLGNRQIALSIAAIH